MKANKSSQYIISGSWDWDGKTTEKGLFLYRYNASDGSLILLDHILENMKAGFTPIQGKHDLFYVVEECGTLQGCKAGGGGYVHTIRLNRETEKLETVSRNETHAVNPSGCALSEDGRYLVAVHHTSSRNIATKLTRDENGNVLPMLVHDDAAVVLFHLNEDGTIGSLCDYDVYADSDSKVSLLHSVYSIPNTGLLVSGDKGLDAVHAFRIENGKLIRVNDVNTMNGSDSRYIALHPRLPLFYVNNEQKPLVYTCSYDQNGIRLVHTARTITEDADYKAMASDIVITRDGKHLYNALRICDEIAQFDIDEEGIPHFVKTVKGNGGHSRGMALSPDGRFLFICNMEADNITCFSINPDNGELTQHAVTVQSRAANLAFVRNEE